MASAEALAIFRARFGGFSLDSDRYFTYVYISYA